MAYKRCYDRYSECRPKWEYYLRDMDRKNEAISRAAIRGAVDEHIGWFKYNSDRIFGKTKVAFVDTQTPDKTGVRRSFTENGVRIIERGSKTSCFTPLFSSGGE